MLRRCRRRRRSPCSARACSRSRTVDVEGAGCTAAATALDAVVEELEGANVLRVDTGRDRAATRERSRGSRTPGSPPTSRTGRGSRSASASRSIAYQGADGRVPGARQRRPGARRDRAASRSAYLELFVDRTGRRPGSRRDGAAPGIGPPRRSSRRCTPQMRARSRRSRVDREARPTCAMLIARRRRRHRGPLRARRRTWSISSFAFKPR